MYAKTWIHGFDSAKNTAEFILIAHIQVDIFMIHSHDLSGYSTVTPVLLIGAWYIVLTLPITVRIS